jgi:tetratricopeptide (TPR) repeat protein
MGNERRAHPRHGLEVGVSFRKDGTQARTHDLSLGGCAIVAPRLRLVNERLQIALSHPKTREELDVVGDVKRAVSLPDGKFLLGVQFVDVDDALRAKLAAFIESSVPAVHAKAASADEATRLVAEAAREEHAGNVPQAIALLEKAIAVAPSRADILATRARLASRTGDLKGATSWAKKAADVDPENTTYAQLHQRFLKDGNAGTSASTARPIFPPNRDPRAVPNGRPSSFLPTDRRSRMLALAAGAALVGIAGWNLLNWVVR